MRPQLLSIAVVLSLSIPAAASAQPRMPHKDANAVGGEVGVFIPRADGWSTGPELDGFVEHYLTARDSLRVGVGWQNPKLESNSDDRMRQIRLGAEIVHNWEGGAVHPFVGAGLGAFFLQERLNGTNIHPSTTQLGGTLLGGVEYFTSKTFAVKGEARYNIVSKSGGFDPSGLSLTIGVKSYF